MVYKKYICRNGKKYGPYTYHSRRVGGKVVSDYGGRIERRFFGHLSYLLLFLVLALGVFALGNYFFTSNVVLEIDNGALVKIAGSVSSVDGRDYRLTGGYLDIVLGVGEGIPKDGTDLILSWNGGSREFLLSEVYFGDTFEQDGLSVFGRPGTGTVYPDVEFDLLISQGGAGGESEFIPTFPRDFGGKNVNPSVSRVDAGGFRLVPSVSYSSSSKFFERDTDSSVKPSDVSVSLAESVSVKDFDFSATESVSKETEPSLTESILTGAVVEGSASNVLTKRVSGRVNGNPSDPLVFSYTLGEGESFLRVESRDPASADLEVSVQGNELEVSTDYSVNGLGFGDNFRTDESYIIRILLDPFEITSSEGRIDLRAGLFNDRETLASAKKTFVYDPSNELSDFDESSVAEGSLSPDFAGRPDFIETDAAGEFGNSFVGTVINKEGLENFVGGRADSFTILNSLGVETVVKRISLESGLFGEEKQISASGVRIISGGLETVQSPATAVVGGDEGESVLFEKKFDASGYKSVTLHVPENAYDVEVSWEVIPQEKVWDFSESYVEESLKDESDGIDVRLVDQNAEMILEKSKRDFSGAGFGLTAQAISEEGLVLESEGVELAQPDNFAERLLVLVKRALGIEEVIVGTRVNGVYPLSIDTSRGVREVSLSYKVPPPVIQLGEVVDRAEQTVTVSSDSEGHIYNVLTSVPLPPGMTEAPVVFWEEGGMYLPTILEDVNGDGAEEIVWVAPILSEQTFRIIYVSKAEHLDENKLLLGDLYESVRTLDGNWSEIIPSGHFVRVHFETELNSSNDITVYARSNGTSEIEVYLEDSEVLIAKFERISSSDRYRVYLDNLLGGETYGTFDLKILGDSVEFDYIVDPGLGAPEIIFGEDTVEDEFVQSNDSVLVSLESSAFDDHYSFVNFNGDVLLWVPGDYANSTAFFDLSGFDHYGLLNSGAKVNLSGYWGSALDLDGSSNVELTGDLRPDSDFSVSAWVKVDDLSGEGYFLSYGDGLDESGFGLGYGNGSSNAFKFRIFDEFGENVILSSEIISEGWHHVVGVYGGGAMKIYVDGTLKKTQNGIGEVSYGSGLGRWKIGGQNGHFRGLVDELFVFDRALIENEILALKSAAITSYVREFSGLDYGIYGFRGFVVDKDGDLNWTEERRFLVNSLPSVELISPEDDAVVLSSRPSFRWDGFEEDGDIIRYDLNVSLSESVGCYDNDRFVSGVLEENYEFGESLVPLECFSESGSSYVWKVRGFDGFGYGEWSAERSFTVSEPVLTSPPIYSIQFETANASVGGTVPVYLRFVSGDGSEPVLVNSIIEIYDSRGEKVEFISLGSSEVQPFESVEYEANLDTSGYLAGDYRAVAVVQFNGEEMVAESVFRLGSLFVGVLDYTRILREGEVNEFYVEVENYWDEPISGVYVVWDVEGLGEVQTLPVELGAWEKSRIKGSLDLGEVSGKVLNVEILVYYGDKVTFESAEVFVEGGMDYILLALVLLVVAALIVLVVLAVISFFRRPKRKRR